MLSSKKKIHFIGIGGIGMSGIAELLFNLGFIISGSDIKKSDRTIKLLTLGIKISFNHKEGNIKTPDVVVYSSAIKNDNVEIVVSKKKGIPVIRRAEMLGELLKLKKISIAIAGSHGKTTTCSILGMILAEAKLQPTLVIGGIVKNIDSNSILGEGDIIVVEADEFDRSFLSLKPTMGIINNLDLEHLDYYKNIQEIKNAFLTFANLFPFYGILGVCCDDRYVNEILPDLNRPIKKFGFNETANIRATNILHQEFKSSFDLNIDGKYVDRFEINIPGDHNISNCLAAITIATELNIDTNTIKKGIINFQGVQRRLEVTHKLEDGTILIDDYAHHPTEILASLSAIKQSFKNRIITVFQPHLFSRTKILYNDFAKALSISDIIVLSSIYAAREKPIENVSSRLIYNEIKNLGHHDIYLNEDDNKIPNLVKGIYNSGDIIVTMGAGNIFKQNINIYKEIAC